MGLMKSYLSKLKKEIESKAAAPAQMPITQRQGIINHLDEIDYSSIDSLISDIVDNYMADGIGDYKKAISLLKNIIEPMKNYAKTNDIKTSTDADKFLQYLSVLFVNLASCYEVIGEFEDAILYSCIAVKIDLNTDINIFQQCTRRIERSEKRLNLNNTFRVLKLAAEYDVPSHMEYSSVNSEKYKKRTEKSIENLNSYTSGNINGFM